MRQAGSGLPFEYEGIEADTLVQYGPAVVSQLNFDRGRVWPLLAVNGPWARNLYNDEKMNVHFQR